MKLLNKIYHKIVWLFLVESREILNSLFSRKRRRKLKGTNFTILSNNCWGGHVYRYFGLRYQSPTVGMYFYPDEYLKFVKNYKYYLSLPLTFLPSYKDSKYASDLERKNEVDIPIARLGDVEIVMLHYRSKEEAREKWNRRVKHMNLNYVLIKNSYQNGMTDDNVIDFDAIEHKNKFIFVTKDYPGLDSTIIYKRFKGKGQIKDDVTLFKRYVDIYSLINNLYA